MATTDTKESKNDNDWRKGVSQSQRNAEIRGISVVLSSLEPGSTPNQKLMLSMRFEDQFFKSCKSYKEYQTKMLKRLNKLKKNYKHSDVKQVKSKEVLLKEKEVKLELELRELYGAKFVFILENATQALLKLTEKQGKEGAKLLKRHVDYIAKWAVELGVVQHNYKFYDNVGRKKTVPRPPNFIHSIKDYLSKTVDTIRFHMMKLTSPDLYLKEELIKIEQEMTEHISKELNTAITHIGLVGLSTSPQTNATSHFDTLIKKANISVPPARSGNEKDLKESRLLHISKIQSATEALVSCISASDKPEKGYLLKKMHVVTTDGLTFLEKNCLADETYKNHILLEDAWNNVMEYKPKSEPPSQNNDALSAEPSAKRQRLSTRNSKPTVTVLKTKILLTPGRKISSHLSSALAEKQAHYARPSVDGIGARVSMKFGLTIEMTIFFSPLLVRIHAIANNSEATTAEGNRKKIERDSDHTNNKRLIRGTTTLGESASDGYSFFPPWKPPNFGLCQMPIVSISGISGSHSTVGCTVAKRLEYSSAKATHVLRRCFSDLAGPTYSKPNCSEFEIEISETSALLQFIEIAQETYTIKTQ